MSTLDDTYKNGIFKLDVDVTNHTAGNKEVTVAYELLDAAKKVVAEGNTPCPVTADGQKSISLKPPSATSRPGHQNTLTCTGY